MAYLAELLVVMTDRLKIVRICARNVRRVYTDTSAFRRRVSRVSLKQSDGVFISQTGTDTAIVAIEGE